VPQKAAAFSRCQLDFVSKSACLPRRFVAENFFGAGPCILWMTPGA
jgi:hypothetical protein